MFGLLTAIPIGLGAVLLAQLTITPGPGGGPIAPGPPVQGYTPGGVGLGGTFIAPGAAARDVPVYRIAPGGVPVLVLPGPDPERKDSILNRYPGCGFSVPCLPESLALTIDSRKAGAGTTPAPDAPINSISELFAALRACWAPPAREQAQEGMQMTVRFSFRRTGDIIAPPFVTYTKPGAKADVKQTYRRAIDAALDRCNRLPFSDAFKSAIAGRPISVRFIDDRSMAAAPQ
jgi:hypothetical protein